MPTQLEKLRKKAAQLFEQEKYNEIIELLPDDVLEKHNDAELYAWRARANYSLDENDQAIIYAQKAINIDGKYWMGYLARGYAWYNKGDYDKANADFNKTIKLKQNDASVYNIRGGTWDKKGEYDKAIADFSKAIELKPDYTAVYNNRGISWYKKGEYDKAIEDSSKTIELEPDYIDAYLVRGASWDEKGEYNKAIADYNKTIKLKPDFIAYYNRAGSWDNKGEYDKAIADYNKAIKLKPDHVKTYNNRGVSWANKGEYDKAIADFNKAIELKPDHANAFRNRGDAFYNKGDFEKALTDYQKAIEFNNSFSFLNDKIKLAKEKLEEIKTIEASKARQNDKKERLKIEQGIEAIIKTIRETSKSGVNTVVHYTKMPVAEIYVKELRQKMQYSNAIYMNDPMEGKMLFEYLNDKTDKTIEEAYANGEKRTETSVYLGSFLPAEENEGEISHQDELVMWRTYGKDENSREAYGCSVVLNSDFFKVQTSKKDESAKSAKADSNQELLNVVYIKKLKNHKEITNDPKGKIKKALDGLKEQLRNFINLRNKYESKDDFYKDIENTIFKLLSTITYLFKSADYNFENAVRVITYMPRSSDSIKAREISEAGKPPKKFYIESFNYILPYIKKIYLGPKVETHQQWSLYFDYEIRQRAIESEKQPDYPHKLNPSEIEILKSDCKFQ